METKIGAREVELLALRGVVPRTAAGGKPANNIARWHIPHALGVNRQGQAATLSWPATGTNFVLEVKEDVAGTNWTVVSTNPAIVDDQCRVTTRSIPQPVSSDCAGSDTQPYMVGQTCRSAQIFWDARQDVRFALEAVKSRRGI